MSDIDSRWSFVPAQDIDITRWSSGSVRTLEDLYSEPIFGSSQRWRCRCGKFEGSEAVGMICPDCNVVITDRPHEVRRQRLGRLELAVVCDHPLFASGRRIKSNDEFDFLLAFPIAPIFYRLKPNGAKTLLGNRYEELVIMNLEVKNRRHSAASQGKAQVPVTQDAEMLSEKLAQIIGVGGGCAESKQSADDPVALLPILKSMIVNLDPDISFIARASLITLKIEARA